MYLKISVGQKRDVVAENIYLKITTKIFSKLVITIYSQIQEL